MKVKIKFNENILVEAYTFVIPEMVGKVVEADYNPQGGYADVPVLELRGIGAGDTAYDGTGEWAFSDDEFEVVPKEIKYGFDLETYEDGKSVEVLQTGDGLSGFHTTFDRELSYVGIGFSYGNGLGIGTKITHPNNTTPPDVDCRWEVRFNNVGSINALIEQLQEIKEILENKEASDD